MFSLYQLIRSLKLGKYSDISALWNNEFSLDSRRSLYSKYLKLKWFLILKVWVHLCIIAIVIIIELCNEISWRWEPS